MSRILIADDSATDRELIGSVVRHAGHTPIFATDGEEALAHAKQSQPALIFLDIIMPKRDGFSTCRELRKNEATSAVKVVMVSARSQTSSKFWAKEQGCDDYITKPFGPQDIENAIQRYV